MVLNGKCSDWADVLSGVPQGSVLGPILFLVFINDLDAATSVIQVMKKFADDTKLGHTVSSDVERGELQGALDNLCRWADLWGMEFNIKKCKVEPCAQIAWLEIHCSCKSYLAENITDAPAGGREHCRQLLLWRLEEGLPVFVQRVGGQAREAATGDGRPLLARHTPPTTLQRGQLAPALPLKQEKYMLQ